MFYLTVFTNGGHLKEITSRKLFNTAPVCFPFLQLHPSMWSTEIIPPPPPFMSPFLSLWHNFSSLSSLSSSENIRKREDYITESAQSKFITSVKIFFVNIQGDSFGGGTELMNTAKRLCWNTCSTLSEHARTCCFYSRQPALPVKWELGQPFLS
jgi:hypothetical protein